MLAPGTLFAGRYEILGPLGAGGMGSVYRARHVELRTEVALKIAGLPLAVDHRVDDGAARFDREARAIAKLDHGNIVRITDYGRTRRHRFIAMQLLEGPTLAQALSAGPLPIARVLLVARQLLAALVHAHARGVLHRDLKPDNVVLVRAPSPDGEHRPERAVLIDFGLAFVDDDAALTARGLCVGSPSYLAPERLDGRPADARADLYALGVLLYEMLAGKRPFAGDSTGEILLAARTRPARPLRAIRREIGKPLDAFVQRALAKDPDRRFSSATQMLAALEDVQDLEQRELEAVEHDQAATFLAIPLAEPSWIARLWSRLRYGRWRWRRAAESSH
jgi:serine/threonine protein kinase